VSPYPRTEKSKLNNYKAKGYTRDGQISKDWLKSEKEQEQRNLDSEKRSNALKAMLQSLNGASDCKDASGKTEAGADQPATKPADKPPVKGQPSTPTSKAGPR
jgi:hypothetical protein